MMTKIIKRLLLSFESARVLSKNVNTQLLDGKFGPDSGENVDFKRPTDYKSVRTSAGDVSSETAQSIIAGKATGTTQNYFTVFVDFKEADEAIKMDQKGQPGQAKTLLGPMSTRIVTDLEVDFAKFMKNNSGLLAGSVGTPADSWKDVAEAGAIMSASGVPMDAPWCYAVNPFTQVALSNEQRSLGAGGPAGSLISEAHKKAIIASSYAGFDKVMTATTLATHTTAAISDRAGTLTAAPTLTYLGAKDTMKQTLAVTAFTASLTVKAGEVIQISGRRRLNLNTKQPMIKADGSQILFTGVVTEDVALGTSGEGNIVISGPGIYEADGAYNTTSTAIASGDVVTLLGAASTLYQPNLFWHRDAFSIGSVPLEKLYAEDCLATTEDGLMMRVCKSSDFLRNVNKVRIDLRPAYSCLNPFLSGQGYGLA